MLEGSTLAFIPVRYTRTSLVPKLLVRSEVMIALMCSSDWLLTAHSITYSREVAFRFASKLSLTHYKVSFPGEALM